MHLNTANIIIVSAVMPTLASVVVAMRIAARFVKRDNGKRIMISDYLIFVSLFFAWMLSITAICGAAIDRVGISPLLQTKVEFTGFLKTMFAVQFLYISSVGFFKLSVLAFYRSIFSTRGFRRVCDATSGIVIAWIVAMLLATLLRSTPISYNWNPTPSGHHGNIVVLFSFVGASDIGLDIFILAMPIPMIRKLHMTTRRKLALSGIFSLGGFCIISSTVRLAFVIKFVAQYHGLSSYYSNLVVENLVWMIVEPSASVIAACLPTLSPLFKDGRGPASLVRSIRSVLSLGSHSDSSIGTEKRSTTNQTMNNQSTDQTGSARALNYGSYSSEISADMSQSHDVENNARRSNEIVVGHQVDIYSSDK